MIQVLLNLKVGACEGSHFSCTKMVQQSPEKDSVVPQKRYQQYPEKSPKRPKMKENEKKYSFLLVNSNKSSIFALNFWNDPCI